MDTHEFRLTKGVMVIEQLLRMPIVKIGAADSKRVQFRYMVPTNLSIQATFICAKLDNEFQAFLFITIVRINQKLEKKKNLRTMFIVIARLKSSTLFQ